MSFGKWKLKKNIIREKKAFLLENIYPTPEFWALLESKQLFSSEMVRELKGINRTNSQQLAEMLDKLPGRGPDSFDLFTEVLVQSGHAHVATALKEAEAQRDLLQQQLHPASPDVNLPVQRTQQTFETFTEHHKKMYQYTSQEQEQMDALINRNEELETLVESQSKVFKIFAKLCEFAADTAQVGGQFIKDEFEAIKEHKKKCDDNTKDAIGQFQNGFKKLLTRLKKDLKKSTKCTGCAKQSNKCVCVLKDKLQIVKTQWSVCKQNISSDDRAEEKANQLTSALDQLSSVVDNQMKKTQRLEDGVRGVLHNVDQMEYFARESSRASSAIRQLDTKTSDPTRLQRHEEQIQQQLQTKQKLLKDIQENMSLQIKSASKRHGELATLMSSTGPTTATVNTIATQTVEPPNTCTLNAAVTDTNSSPNTQKVLSTTCTIF